MLGLIKKDLLMIKSNIKILIILLFVYGFMAIEGEIDLSFLIPFISVMIMMSTFSYDAFNKWDAYAVTLPKGRKNSVKAKYLATLLLIFISTMIITILSLVISYIRTKDIMLMDNLSLMLGSLFATVLIQSFMYPTIYKFGVEKARIGIFVVVFAVVMISGLLSHYINTESLKKVLSFMDNYFIIILPVLMILMIYISYKISERIFLKKEF